MKNTMGQRNLLCVLVEQRRHSMKVDKTPENGEESSSFGGEPKVHSIWIVLNHNINKKKGKEVYSVVNTSDKMKKEISLREMQDVEFGILYFFKEICDKHGLRYYLAYGTLLGAVRHSGFIPWDDDVDVWMPREDYNRFVEIFEALYSSNLKSTESRYLSWAATVVQAEKIKGDTLIDWIS